MAAPSSPEAVSVSVSQEGTDKDVFLFPRDHAHKATFRLFQRSTESLQGTLCISAGPKDGHYHQETNEDAGALVSCPKGAMLLVVVDGHSGATSSDTFIRVLQQTAAQGSDAGAVSPFPWDEAAQESLEGFRRATLSWLQAVYKEILKTKAGLPEQHRTAAAFSIALVTKQRVFWAGMGDCMIIPFPSGDAVQDGAQSKALTHINPLTSKAFIGYTIPEDQVASNLEANVNFGELPSVPPRLLLTRDGIPDYFPSQEEEGGGAEETAKVGAVRGSDTFFAALESLKDAPQEGLLSSIFQRTINTGYGDNMCAAVVDATAQHAAPAAVPLVPK
uniref:PPM-type phosphatase domain-containing protein n=1 Tax=Chromera velia CCMP2878 TaxID=1169474 RepID=A0A0G4GZB8_9ALVE|eukprot:Cvel_24020.t1-p1 / transcript=Cvel_24020.t1 / gene=Cvel_24020 / organism=Chromera_velia_CCMP2878 / gene_product=hypothetical protein / transcript_product=hypothetical protein / location=Cvel_scaffold2549:1042-2034(-) / protein_length=331 / sequence_SO=supercontig / SO=protein_coding / is_pseudo=false